MLLGARGFSHCHATIRDPRAHGWTDRALHALACALQSENVCFCATRTAPIQSPLILVLPPPAPSPLPQSLRELMHRHGLNPRPRGASTRMHVYALTGSHCVPLATTWFSRADRVLAHAGETGGTTWRCIAYTSCCPPHGPYRWFARSQPYGCFARSQRGPSLHSPRPCQRLPLGHFELYLVEIE